MYFTRWLRKKHAALSSTIIPITIISGTRIVQTRDRRQLVSLPLHLVIVAVLPRRNCWILKIMNSALSYRFSHCYIDKNTYKHKNAQQLLLILNIFICQSGLHGARRLLNEFPEKIEKWGIRGEVLDMLVIDRLVSNFIIFYKWRSCFVSETKFP